MVEMLKIACLHDQQQLGLHCMQMHLLLTISDERFLSSYRQLTLLDDMSWRLARMHHFHSKSVSTLHLSLATTWQADILKVAYGRSA